MALIAPTIVAATTTVTSQRFEVRILTPQAKNICTEQDMVPVNAAVVANTAMG